MKLYINEDKELWSIKSDAWEFPLFAQPAFDDEGEKVWVLLVAITLHIPQYRIISQMLKPLSRTNESDRWVLNDKDFLTIATKCPGITPRWYFRLNGTEPTAQEMDLDENPDAPDPDDAFIRDVWHRSQIVKFSVFKVVWAALINGVAHRLIIDNKPVDLGWFKIHALPYRVNWKHNLLHKHPKLHVYLDGMTSSLRAAQMKINGVIGDMFRTDCMATRNKEGRTTFRWSLEILTTPEWHKYTDEVELQRLKGSTPEAYLSRWGTIVSRLKQSGVINALLSQFLREMSLPAGQPHQISVHRGPRLIPYTPTPGRSKVRLDRIPGDLVLDCCETSIRGPEDNSLASKPVKEVQPLPVLRPDLAHMRNARRNLPESVGEGSAGMHVLAANCDGEPKEAVLRASE